jgi:hypothetical protein
MTKSGERWSEIADLDANKTERNALFADAFSREETRLMLPAEGSDQ